MKPLITFACSIAWLLAFEAPLNTQGQSFTIDDPVLGFGDQASSGGDYSISGSTIPSESVTENQADSFSIEGSFSQIPAVPSISIGVPNLSLSMVLGRLALSWPSTGTADYELQECSDLSPDAVWLGVPGVPAELNGERQLLLDLGPGNRFFRLRLR